MMRDEIRVMEFFDEGRERLIATGKPISSYNVLLKMPISEEQLESFIHEVDTRFVLSKAFVMPNKLTFGVDRNYFYVLGGPADKVSNPPISATYFRYREMAPYEVIVEISADNAILDEIGTIIKKFDEKAFGGMSGPDNHSGVKITYRDGSVLHIFMSDWSLYFCTKLVKARY